MTIKLIFAKSQNNVIGKDGKIPWYLSDDLKRFSSLTKNSIVIMGRKTWESLPDSYRPLPGRINIVVSTRGVTEHTKSAIVTNNLRNALAFAKNNEVAWIIGGSRLYNEAIHIADFLEVTEVHQDFEGDTFAPEIDDTWVETRRERRKDSLALQYNLPNPVEFSFVTYKKLKLEI